MTRLDINRLNRRGVLQEGSIIKLPRQGGAAALSGQGKRTLIAGVGGLYWALGELACEGDELACEWELVPIITRNPPRSWGANTWRARPRFRCPFCSAGAYHLFLTARGFACRRCGGVEYPSRVSGERDEDAALRRRLAKMRAEVGVVSPFEDPLPPPGVGPRTRWMFYRRLRELRRMEWRLLASCEALCNRMELRLARAKGRSTA
jgi:hypothetical protein